MKLQKYLLFPVLTLALLPVLSVGNADAQSESFRLISATDYFDAAGIYHIVGEIENTSDRVAQFVEITATLYDSNQNVVGRPFGYAFIDVMRSGERSAFNLVFFDSNQASKISSYSLNVSATPANDKPRNLEVIPGDSYIDAAGFYHHVGEVVNNGPETATFVEVSGAFYDSGGRAVDAAFGYTSPEDIPAGGRAAYELLVIGPNVGQISSASINADSQEYAAVPEFPVGVLVAVAGVMGAVAIITRLRGNLWS
jgi:hypothetical protein